MVWPFRGKPNYETRLSGLSDKIRQSNLRLARLRSSHRRLRGRVLLHSTLLYVVYLLFLFISNRLWQPLHITIIAGFPLVILSVRYLLDYLYKFWITRQQSLMARLETDRENVIEEYKQKTEYYKIRKVLDAAEASSDPESSPEPPEPLERLAGTPNPQFSTPPARQPARQTWVDRLLDTVLGENEQSPNNRFALICSQCYHHNGLASYGQVPEEVIYICPYCGHKNGEPALASVEPESLHDFAEFEHTDASQTPDAESDRLSASAYETEPETPSELQSPVTL